MIVIDSFSYQTDNQRLTLYLDESLIYMMTGPFENDNKVWIRYLYIKNLDYPIDILDTTDNYDKIIKVLEEINNNKNVTYKATRQ